MTLWIFAEEKSKENGKITDLALRAQPYLKA
jgi:hypothetical protein